MDRHWFINETRVEPCKEIEGDVTERRGEQVKEKVEFKPEKETVWQSLKS